MGCWRWWSRAQTGCGKPRADLGCKMQKDFCVAYRMMPAMLESNAQMW